MTKNKNQLIKGGIITKKFLYENDIEFVSESSLFFFYRKGLYVYVFDKSDTNHPDEYLLVAIWED
ncbi:MAG: hypothetical protein ACOYO1_10115 [Bacteroidales bacterium]